MRRCSRSTSRAASTAHRRRRTGTCCAADRTVTFPAVKPGLCFGPGRDLAGDVEVVDIGLDVSSATVHLVEASRRRALVAAASLTPTSGTRRCASSPAVRDDRRRPSRRRRRAACRRRLVHVSSPGVDASSADRGHPAPVPAFDWADAVLDDLVPLPRARGRARARPRRRHRPVGARSWSSTRRRRSSSTVTGCSRWRGTRDGAPRCCARGRCRRSSPRTTASTRCSPVTAPSATGSRPRGGWPPTPAPPCC